MTILVGTYHDINYDWIIKNKLYNLPVNSQGNENDYLDFTHIVLIKEKRPVLAYSARHIGYSTTDVLKKNGYKTVKNHKNKKYFLFHLEEKIDSYEEFLADQNSKIMVYTTGFNGIINQESYQKQYLAGKGKSIPEIFKVLKPFVGHGKVFYGCREWIQPELFYDVGKKSSFPIPLFPPKTKTSFTFIDLFAGIGGFRIAAQNLGGRCVFSSEFDSKAQKTYAHNFGDIPHGDITLKSTKDAIPNGFDCLFGGFPCQPFSIAGYQKGFSDTRGTLFYDIAEILKGKHPPAVFLENVKNLTSHDDGKTFDVIKSTLENLGYVVFYKVMNAMEYANIPQNRERIFIVCFDPVQVPNYHQFKFPSKKPLTKKIDECIDSELDDDKLIYTQAMSHYDELKRDITDVDSIYQWRRQYVRKNQSHVCPTLTANMGTGGHNVPLIIRRKLDITQNIEQKRRRTGYNI